METMIIDIEVLQDGDRFPKPEYAKQPIICLTIYDNYLNHYYTIIQKNTLKESIIKKEENWKVIQVDNEIDLLKLFIKIYNELDPDTITGWNVNFDVMYLLNRIKKLELDPSLLSPIYRVSVDDMEIGGKHILDMLRAYKKVKEKPSYSLKFIAKEENVSDKTEDAEDIPWLYENDLERLLIYNKYDVQICNELENKLKLIEQFKSMIDYVGVNDINAPFMFSKLLDTLSLRIAKQDGVVLPSKKFLGHIDYKGAIVINPDGGLHNNVIIIDMNKYYPSIILTLNLSPETFGKDTDEWGIIPKMVLYLIEQRKRYEAELKKLQPGTEEYDNLARKRQVVKDLVNSVYGFLGYSKSRLFRIEMAEKVTEVSRMGLQFIREIIEKEKGYKVIYGDTDSIFVKIGEGYTTEEVVEKGNELKDFINEKLNEFIKKQLNVKRNYISVDFEKIYDPILLIPDTKKRYACRVKYEKGKYTDYFSVTGFDTIRSDTPEILSEIQGELLKKIIYGEDKDKIIEYIRKYYKDIRNGVYGPKELAIPKGISKPLLSYGAFNEKTGKNKTIPFHVKAAMWSNKYLGTNFDEGDKVKVLYVKRIVGYPNTKYIAFTDDMKLPELVIDKEEHIRWLRSKTEKILDLIGIKWERIEGTRTLFEVLK